MDDPHVQLMLKFQRGDEDAFRQLFDAYKTSLLNFVYRFCQDRQIAEELSQEVFLRVYKNASSYRPEAKFSTWLYRIATNICLNERRAGKYRYETDLQSGGNRHTAHAHEPVDQRTNKKIDEQIVEQEHSQTIKDAVMRLPEKQRMALLFSVYDQLSYKEIAQRLDCSEGAVKSIIHRAKISIKDMLKNRTDRTS